MTCQRLQRQARLLALALAVSLLAHDPAQAGQTNTYSGTFNAVNQGAWGPNPNTAPPDASLRLFQVGWNEAANHEAISTVAGQHFGVGLSMHTSGNIGLQFTVRDTGSGSVSVDYPMTVHVLSPAVDTFRPGDTVRIQSSLMANPGAALITTPPGTRIGLSGQLNVNASAHLTGCIFGCAGAAIFPPFGGHSYGGQVVEVSVPNHLPVLGIPGVSGWLARPDVNTSSAVVGHDLQATGSDVFGNVNLDVDRILVGNCLRFQGPRRSQCLAIFGASIPGFIPGVSGNFSLVDVVSNLQLSQAETYTFRPTVHVTLNLTVPVRYVVRTGGGVAVASGISSSIPFNIGQDVDITVPPLPDGAIVGVSPDFGFSNSLQHDVNTTLTQDLRLDIGQAHASVGPHTVVPGYCWPETCAFGGCCCGGCTPDVTFPGASAGFGPLRSIDLDFADFSFTDSTLFDRNTPAWEVPGTFSMAQPPFIMDPQYVPIARIDGPVAITIPEGTDVSVDSLAGINDPDWPETTPTTDADGDAMSFYWDFGDGRGSCCLGATCHPELTSAECATAAGTWKGPGAECTPGRCALPTDTSAVSVNHAYGDEGTYTIGLTADDHQGIAGTTSLDVTITNVAPDLVPDAAATFDEGSVASLSHVLFDPGYLDTFTVAADWDDGSVPDGFSLASRNDRPLPRPPSVPVDISHVYGDEGTWNVETCVTDSDSAVDCETVMVTTTNVAPTIEDIPVALATSRVVGIGEAIEVRFASRTEFNDKGTLDTHAAELLWGDGATEPLPVLEAPFGPPGDTDGANGEFGDTRVHSYTTRGTPGAAADGRPAHVIEVAVDDDDGGRDVEEALRITVAEGDLDVVSSVAPVGSVAVGANVRYTYSVRNDGPDPVTDITLTDVLPAGTSLVSAIRSGSGSLTTRLLPSSQEAFKLFGFSVAEGDGTLFVGARESAGIDGTAGPGTVSVFERMGGDWTEVDVLFAADGQDDDWFGSTLAVSGDTALVGSPGADDAGGCLDACCESGVVHVFNRTLGTSDWEEGVKLRAIGDQPGARFGYAVALQGDTAVIGAPLHDVGGAIDAGRAYVFARVAPGSWLQVAQLQASDAEAGDGFGRSVALDGDTIVVGADRAGGVAGAERGAAYVFSRDLGGPDNWGQAAILVSPDPFGPGRYGTSLALQGDTLLVAADVPGALSTVYVHRGGGAVWPFEGLLNAGTGELFDGFGQSLDLRGDVAVVAAGVSDHVVARGGAAYLFRRDGTSWSDGGLLVPSSLSHHDRMGFGLGAVAIGEDAIIVGASCTDVIPPAGGSLASHGVAHVFETCVEDPAGRVVCGLGTMDPGETLEVEITARIGCAHNPPVFVSTDIVNTATVVGLGLDPNPNNNVVTDTHATTPPAPGDCGSDDTPPVVTPIVTGTLGNDGWFVSDVTVEWIVHEPESVIVTPPCPTTTVDVDVSGLDVTCTATGLAGDGGTLTTTETVTIKRDVTPPTIVPVVTGTLGGAGWHVSSIDVTFDCSDGMPGSGVASCDGATTLSAEGHQPAVFGSVEDRAGNTASAVASGLKIDLTPPTLSAVRTDANSNGWNADDVTVSYTCSDAHSGVSSCPPDAVVTGEGAGLSVNVTVSDEAGHSTPLLVGGINIDRTPPVITANASPVANAAGWNADYVTVSFTCSDALSGVGECSDDELLIDEGTGLSASGEATDLAGNVATVTQGGISIDYTPPTIVASVSPGPGPDGVSDRPVTVSYACTDGLSGVDSCPPPTVLNDLGFGQSASGTARDVAGNLATAGAEGINIGRPAIIPAPSRTVAEGTLLTGEVSTVEAFVVTTGIALLNWGDGTLPEAGVIVPSGEDASVRGEHAYGDDGQFMIETCSQDLFLAPVCGLTEVVVSNVAPDITSVDSPPTVRENSALTVEVQAFDAGRRDVHEVTYDWGDGSLPETVPTAGMPQGLPGEPGGIVVTASVEHVYAAPGVYTVQICVTDDDGGSDCQSVTVEVAEDPFVRPMECFIDVGAVQCNGATASIPVSVATTNTGDAHVIHEWVTDRPGASFADPAAASTTLIVDITTDPLIGFPISCRVRAVDGTSSPLTTDETSCSAFVFRTCGPNGGPSACENCELQHLLDMALPDVPVLASSDPCLAPAIPPVPIIPEEECCAALDLLLPTMPGSPTLPTTHPCVVHVPDCEPCDLILLRGMALGDAPVASTHPCFGVPVPSAPPEECCTALDNLVPPDSLSTTHPCFTGAAPVTPAN